MYKEAIARGIESGMEKVGAGPVAKYKAWKLYSKAKKMRPQITEANVRKAVTEQKSLPTPSTMSGYRDMVKHVKRQGRGEVRKSLYEARKLLGKPTKPVWR